MAKVTLRKQKVDTKSSTSKTPSFEQIQEKAYLIWERKGRPLNSDMDNWLEAEREFRRR